MHAGWETVRLEVRVRPEVARWLEVVQGDGDAVATALEAAKAVMELAASSSTSGRPLLDKIKRLETEMAAAVESHTRELAGVRDKESALRQGEIEQLRRQIAEKNSQLSEMWSQIRTELAMIRGDEVRKLQDAVKEREFEIKALKTMNCVKGAQGEELILRALQATFKESAVTHTGKTAHECDIHLTDTVGQAVGRTIAFESKFKATITRQDVEKFQFDVNNLATSAKQGQPIIGSVFVSILSSNIPAKGNMLIELIAPTESLAHSVPVMYLGFSSQNEFMEQFPSVVTVFHRFANVMYAAHEATRGGDAAKNKAEREATNATVQQVVAMFQTLSANQGRIEQFKVQVMKFANDLAADNATVLKHVDEILARHGVNPTLAIAPVQTVAKKGGKNQYTCDQCVEVFTNKKTHATHQRACARSAAPHGLSNAQQVSNELGVSIDQSLSSM